MNVAELLTSKNIKFFPKGKDYLTLCLNPQHEDNNPSMRIDQVTGIFHCFSCGYKGNVFKLYGEKPNELELKREMLRRKINDKRSESIGLSFPPNSIPYKGTWRDISVETYEKFEAFTCPASEFVGRIVFPIRTVSGNIRAFIGRHQGAETPKYYIYPVRAKLPLFPTPAPINSSIILVEGIYDLLNLYDKGLTNVSTCFGVNNVTEAKLALLKISGISTIYTFFDNDSAGQAGATKVKELAESMGFEVKNIQYGDKNADPGSLSAAKVKALKNALYSPKG
jgi:DNA primase